jgi:hypothetical protein
MHSRGERARDPAWVRLAADWVHFRQREILFRHAWKDHVSQGVTIQPWTGGRWRSPSGHPATHVSGFLTWSELAHVLKRARCICRVVMKYCNGTDRHLG